MNFLQPLGNGKKFIDYGVLTLFMTQFNVFKDLNQYLTFTSSFSSKIESNVMF